MNYHQETLKILIVDDEPGMCFGAERSLRSFQVSVDNPAILVSFAIQSVLSGSEYRERIRSDAFDLILLDYKLPDVSGLDLLQELTETQRRDCLVIMMTAYATFETAVQATKLGAYDFLAKPFTPEELRNSVKKATIRLILSKHARKFEEEKRQIRFQFISVLSHELKAPLNAIEGYLSLLGRPEKLSPEDYQTMINRSKIRLDGMRKLIFDLLDLTRIESGQKKRVLSEMNLTELVRTAIELFQLDAEKQQIKIHFDGPEQLPFMADKTEMEIIVNNLISNSIKYNKPGGEVSISLSEAEQEIHFKVADTGIGLDAKDIAKLFKEFIRIKNEKTVHILGSGLGLSTVKKIANLYGGDITVTSIPDQGSTFFVTMPKQLPALS